MNEQKRLTWDEIKRLYDKQWVELVDYNWPEGTPYPAAGVVRTHNADRRKFHSMIKDKQPAGSALVYVGSSEVNPGEVRNNLFRVVTCS